MNDTTFTQRSLITVDDFSLILEEELIEIPDGYDDDGEIPTLRILVQYKNQTLTCTCLREFASSAAQLNLPVPEFCSQYPAEFATMITTLEQMRRPIQNNALFQYLESDGHFKLDEIEPRFIDGLLVWHELRTKSDSEIQKRCLSANTVSLVGDEVM